MAGQRARGAEQPPGRPVRGAEARLLRRLHPPRDRRDARPAARHGQEPHAAGPGAAAPRPGRRPRWRRHDARARRPPRPDRARRPRAPPSPPRSPGSRRTRPSARSAARSSPPCAPPRTSWPSPSRQLDPPPALQGLDHGAGARRGGRAQGGRGGRGRPARAAAPELRLPPARRRRARSGRGPPWPSRR